MFFIDNAVDPYYIYEYYNKINKYFHEKVSQGASYTDFYPARNMALDKDDKIIKIVQDLLESKLRIKLTCHDAELQTWPIGVDSALHVHGKEGGRPEGDYNSLLYLNDNFEEGEFYTGHGVTLKPKKNRLTFFDGKNIPHGVKKVHGHHRYTAIFWWTNTKHE